MMTTEVSMNGSEYSTCWERVASNIRIGRTPSYALGSLTDLSSPGQLTSPIPGQAPQWRSLTGRSIFPVTARDLAACSFSEQQMPMEREIGRLQQ